MNRLYLRLKRHWLNLNTTIEVKNCFIFMTFFRSFSSNVFFSTDFGERENLKDRCGSENVFFSEKRWKVNICGACPSQFYKFLQAKSLQQLFPINFLYIFLAINIVYTFNFLPVWILQIKRTKTRTKPFHKINNWWENIDTLKLKFKTNWSKLITSILWLEQ